MSFLEAIVSTNLEPNAVVPLYIARAGMSFSTNAKNIIRAKKEDIFFMLLDAPA
jgi:hypothetical protein